MRPEGRGALDSLYFNYPHFDPPTVAERAQNCFPVAIVGAGPVGMTAALTLARYGIRSVLLEQKSTFNDGSRAICISRSSFQTFERIGALGPFLDKALPWTRGRTFYRGQQILEFDMPDSADEKFRPMYNLQQQYIEHFLWQAVRASPLIDLRWQSEVKDLADLPSGVSLSVHAPNARYDLSAEFVIAADGAHSPLRRMRGLRLNGDNYPGRYVIADVQMEHDYPTIRRALFDPASRRGGTVLVHRQADNIWRIDYQLGPGEDAAEATRESNIRASVEGVLRDIGHNGPWALEWWSVYSANTLALDDYRDGNVFFAGDSAHIVPIFGVRGLNNGIADAENIGWKLAFLLKGLADKGLLESYSPERRGATLDVFEQSSKSARFMTPPSKGFALMRDAALSLALEHSWAGELANPRQMTPFQYSRSPWIRADQRKDHLAPGRVLPDFRLKEGFLSDRLGPRFSLVHFGHPKIGLGEGIQEIALETASVQTPQSLLIRPDGYILARWQRPAPAEVQLVMSRALHIAQTTEGQP